MLAIIQKLLLRRSDAPTERAPTTDPLASRAGAAVAGVRPGSQAHRPSAAERDLAGRLGVGVHDPTDHKL